MASAFKCAIFDLDGVITETARLHSTAWKAMFDDFLRGYYARRGQPFKEFTDHDYLQYVDGKPRYQGVKSFLDSRGVDLPMGDPEDSVDRETCCGLGNRKNVNFQHIIETEGADVFQTSVDFVRELKRRGIRVGVASSSKNTVLVLKKAKLEDLFETRVRGLVSAELGLKGKPDPDIFVVAAKNLGYEPVETMMVEDAISGVTAGFRGKFGLVLGIARHIPASELKQCGADIVVKDLGEITVDQVFAWFDAGKHRKA
jgi:beta-phosphoglucomutase family hydrolase